MKNIIALLTASFCALTLAGCNSLTGDPSVQELCKHFSSCDGYPSTYEACVSNLSNSSTTLADCEKFNKALQRCQYKSSCEDLLARKTCQEETQNLKACTAELVKKQAQEAQKLQREAIEKMKQN